MHKMFPAILVLLTARMLGGTNRQVNYLAGIVQFIQAATDIHRLIPDEGKNQLSLEKTTIPFSVLVGDLFYAHVFSLLSQGGLLAYLTPLSRTICQIHEGGVIRKEFVETGFATEEHILETRELEFASLPSIACRIAGELCGASTSQLMALEQLGRAVGMLTGSRMVPASAEQMKVWMEEALDALEQLPQGAMSEACKVMLTQLYGKNRNESFNLSIDVKSIGIAPSPRAVVV
ncbi:polyprenyl synthetase family protein [Heliobacterium chlorum]|uniref:Polyprenyl synthetase family protein n=2 Tax=Heliobacterium chlorum TaxID=2698 RepID=A0ABR7SX69_HELCL|nr:polyprenyl synthetase family protein [Heliobacterium chlorum]